MEAGKGDTPSKAASSPPLNLNSLLICSAPPLYARYTPPPSHARPHPCHRRRTPDLTLPPSHTGSHATAGALQISCHRRCTPDLTPPPLHAKSHVIAVAR
nr:hypothetical protein Iba_scaffold5942CG0090 [Ipomoea batatas]